VANQSQEKMHDRLARMQESLADSWVCEIRGELNERLERMRKRAARV